MMRSLLYPSVLLAALIPAGAAAQAERFPTSEEIRGLVERMVPAEPGAGIVVGLLEADGSRRVVVVCAPGGAPCPLTRRSVFEIGSVTKVFTGALLADMARRGEVDLDEPVQALLPAEVRVPSRGGKRITLLDLATHHSGLPHSPSNYAPGRGAGAYPVQRLYDFLGSYTLPREPGERFEYSNLIGLLGPAFGRRAGMPFDALLHARVLEPLGMRNTAPRFAPGTLHHRVRGHSGYGEPAPFLDVPEALAAAGALTSTVDDLLTFAAAHLSARSAAPHAALRDALRPRRGKGVPGEQIGLGWDLRDGPAGAATLATRTGSTFGFGAFTGIDRAGKRAVVVLANYNSDAPIAVGLHLLDGRRPAPLPSAARAAAVEYRRAGVEAAVARYRALRAAGGWRTDEPELIVLGYWLLGRGAAADAVQWFRLGTELFPRLPNPHDSLGDAYRAAGRTAEAVESYRTAVALAEAAGDPQTAVYRKHLEDALRGAAAGP